MDNSYYSDDMNSFGNGHFHTLIYFSEIEQGLKPSEQNTTICEICYEEKPLRILASCHHYFCETCICSYLMIKISEAEVLNITCPSCPSEVYESTVQELLDEEYFQKFRKFYEIKTLEKDVMVRWCPIPDCGGFDKAFVSHHNLSCNKCGHKYCYICSKPWHKGTCKLENDFGFKVFKLTNNIKSCPNCRNYVQKNGGCPHMNCPRCGHKWCWICGGDYSSPRHTELTCLCGNNIFDLYLSFIFLILIFPVLVPFLLLFIVIYFYETESIERDSLTGIFLCFRSRLIVYPLALALSPFIEILIVVLGYFVLSIMISTAKLPNCGFIDILFRIVIGIMSASIIYIVATIICSLIVVLMPCLGLILLIIKIIYRARKLCKSEGEAEYSRML